MSKGKKIAIGLLIISLTIGFIIVAVLKNSGTSNIFSGNQGVSVQTIKIEKGEISSYISASGVVKEVEKADVYFDTPMKVVKLLVDKNQRVSKGQKLAELDMDSLNSELEKLKANRKIQELSANSNALSVEVERAAITLKNAESAYNDSKKEYTDNIKLYEATVITKRELDLSLRAYNDSASALKLASITLKAAQENKNLNKLTAEQNLKVTNIAISDMEKKIDAISKTLISPIDGIISEMSLAEGSYTSSVQPAFTIINPDKLQVKADVREYDIKDVAVGQLVTITGDAIDKDNPVAGKVYSISPVATARQTVSGQETAIEVIIDVTDTNGLKPGLSVSCDISTLDRKGVLIAPMEVFKEDKDGNKLVFVIDTKENIMIETPVKLGISSDMSAEVTEGLKEGDIVVIDPQPAHKNGDKVKMADSEIK